MAQPNFQVPGEREDARNQLSYDIVPGKVLEPYKDSYMLVVGLYFRFFGSN